MDALTDPHPLEESAASSDADTPKSPQRGGGWQRWLSPRRIGAIYVWAVIIVVFGALKPSLFLANQTATGIANSYAIAGIAALALLVPLSAGAFDVSIGATMSLVSVVVAQLLLSTSIPVWLVVLIGLAVGVCVGVVNSIIVVVLKVPSLIGTLAVMGIVDALAIGVSGNATLSGPRLSGSFSTGLVRDVVSSYQSPVLYVLVLMLALGIMLERTQFGRFIYAVGFNVSAARLAGLRVQILQSASLVIGGLIAAWAGIVLTAQLSSSTPSIGDSYLLPAFAAVFLGSTQFRAPRFSAWGTVIAVFMLGTGEYGLQLSGAPSWTPQVFAGVALVAAVALTRVSSGRGFGSRSSAAP